MSAFIWSVADLLRGDYKQSEYGKVILPFTVLRRFDCVLAPTRQDVWDRDASFSGDTPPALLKAVAKLPFYNTSKQTFATIGADPANVRKNLADYVNGFSAEVSEIIERYAFHTQIERLDAAGLLYQVVQKFADPKLDLSLSKVSNHDMGYLFEELIRKFSELSNETAGEHFTPREVIELMVELLIAPDVDALTGDGRVIDILDPACGTGGMLAAAEEHIRMLNPDARINLAGQEINAESYAICRSDMLIKGYDEKSSSIAFGNSFSHDAHEGKDFRYMLANPPFGVEWKRVEKAVKDEHNDRGHAGRFGAGLPRINDGSFLFLQHMMSKMRPVTADVDDKLKGSRLAIVFNGSPLFTGGAGSGESEIRRWIIENDHLEAIIALPDQLFYNTGISTYFWIVTNNKASRNKGKVVLLDARDQWQKIRKSLGEKRKEISKDQRDHVCRIYRNALDIADDPDHPDHAKVKVFRNEDFGYQRITIDRPLRQRFEISEDTLAALAESSAFQKYDLRDELLTGLKNLIGLSEKERTKFRDKLFAGYIENSVTVPPDKVEKAVMAAFSVTDPEGEIQKVAKGKVVHDPDLRDFENVPLTEDIDEYFEREVRPHVPDAWMAETKDPKTKKTIRVKIGYEIPFTRYFYMYTPPRPLEEIDAELKAVEAQIQILLGQVTS
ncbi:SAM-dependent DNA methyltransferase [Actinomadura sp. LCR2-06]|uniref:site-specific DNA-methyltransferase (adenine-specific) n=1 Tax=Actinomadura violacea TaxID=2819934 RepID=A0ABS3RR55_9ACTN|nr:SAM-dependent DNA methyltransferase [Actinomadura violacea]